MLKQTVNNFGMQIKDVNAANKIIRDTTILQ